MGAFSQGMRVSEESKMCEGLDHNIDVMYGWWAFSQGMRVGEESNISEGLDHNIDIMYGW